MCAPCESAQMVVEEVGPILPHALRWALTHCKSNTKNINKKGTCTHTRQNLLHCLLLICWRNPPKMAYKWATKTYPPSVADPDFSTLGNLLSKTRVLKHRVLERKRRPIANASVLGTQRFRTLSSRFTRLREKQGRKLRRTNLPTDSLRNFPKIRQTRSEEPQAEKLEKAVAVRNSFLEGVSANFRRCLESSSPTFQCHCQGLGTFPARNMAAGIQERSWIFPSEIVTAFLTFADPCFPKSSKWFGGIWVKLS